MKRTCGDALTVYQVHYPAHNTEIIKAYSRTLTSCIAFFFAMLLSCNITKYFFEEKNLKKFFTLKLQIGMWNYFDICVQHSNCEAKMKAKFVKHGQFFLYIIQFNLLPIIQTPHQFGISFIFNKRNSSKQKHNFGILFFYGLNPQFIFRLLLRHSLLIIFFCFQPHSWGHKMRHHDNFTFSEWKEGFVWWRNFLIRIFFYYFLSGLIFYRILWNKQINHLIEDPFE